MQATQTIDARAITLDQALWLTSEPARAYLDRVTSQKRSSLTTLVKSLRKELSPQQTHLILEQVELRERARHKFRQADRMFFTRRTLQQATGEDIARYVASRFPAGQQVADLCCGIGGNLLALAWRGPVTGVERDPVVAHLARCNVEAAGKQTVHVQVADAATYSPAGHAAFFIDPDRRAKGRRTVDLEYYQPDLTELERLISICPDASVKLAPATAVPERWRESAELEWIGYARECKQQIAWFGRLARHPGRRTVTICPRGDFKVRTILENPEARAITTDHFGKFLFVLHSAVVAARLVGTLAEQHSLALVQGSADLLTGERLALDQALTSFEAVAECPFDPKRVGSLLRELEIAPQTVRTSGCRINMAKLTAKLPTSGRKRGGLFVRGQGSVRRVTIAVQRD